MEIGVEKKEGGYIDIYKDDRMKNRLLNLLQSRPLLLLKNKVILKSLV